GEFNALQSSLRTLGQKIETVGYELQRLSAQEAEGNQKRDGLAATIAEHEARDGELQQLVSGFNFSLEQLRQTRDTATASLTETKVALATDEQVCSSFRQQQSSLQSRLRELDQLVAARRNEVASFVTKREQFQAEIEASQQRIEALQHEREQVNSQIADLQA